MELADGGDLFDKIEPDLGVPEDIAHFYFFQLINAVSFMHGKGIAHRDLKPENVLLNKDGNLKLADFGLAALFKKDGKSRLCNTVCGSPPYIAPEIVNGRKSVRQDMLDEGYSPDICDIWSCGVVLFVLLVGNTPWDEPTMRSEEFKEFVETRGQTSDELWQQLPQDMVSLLLGMLTIDPASRFTIKDVRSHPWFRQPNPLIGPDGLCTNGVGMSTRMLSCMRIDFNQQPSQSQRGFSQPVDEMDIDSSPRRSNAHAPATPFENMPFEWEDSQRMLSQGSTSAHTSQAMPDYQGTNVFSQLPRGTQEMLSQDPSMSQFSQQKPTPESCMTLTQAARQFKDVLPASTFCQLLSPQPINVLIRLVVDALHQLDVPCTSPSPEQLERFEAEGKAQVQVKMPDSRRQRLNGYVIVERIPMSEAWMSEMRFVKASGDPLEWRRFFKNVVICIGEKVVVRPE